jgi:undecaprenyl-diphosphatase
MMNFNVKLFQKINGLVGRNRWLDLFGKTGAEWVIIGSGGWYIASVFLDQVGNRPGLILRLSALPICWLAGWLIDIFIGTIVQEPRPHITYPETKMLFTPLMSWKSFPSDHAMSAWLIFFLAAMFNVPGFEMLAVLAVWICLGRVYAGCHYPFDIVGGFFVSAFVTLVAYNLLIVYF